MDRAAVVTAMLRAMAIDCQRIECSIKIDYRRTAPAGYGKVASVERSSAAVEVAIGGRRAIS